MLFFKLLSQNFDNLKQGLASFSRELAINCLK